MKKVIIKTLYTKKIGLGHLNAMIFLSNISKKKFNFLFIINNNDDAIRYLRQYKKKYLIDKNFELNSTLISNECDIALFYFPISKFKVSKVKYKTIFMTNTFNKIYSNADVVISDQESQQKFKYNDNFYIGFKYKIFQHNNYKYILKRKIDSCLICIGGTDKNNLIIKIIKLLVKLKSNINFFVFVRSSNMNKKSRDYLNNFNTVNFKVIYDKVHLMHDIKKVDIGIVSGGNILLQMCNANIPTLAIPQDNIEKKNISWLSSKNCTSLLNINKKNFNLQKFESIFQDFCSNMNLRSDIHKSCKSLFKKKFTLSKIFNL